jgi:ABC-type nitrate/sulfonate/bicarbonate transport system substrate-binding protein
MIIERLVNLWIIAGLLIAVATTAAAAQDKVKFPVGVGTKTLGTSLLWLATTKGFFEEVGLDGGAVARYACCRSGAGGRIAVYNNGLG